MNRDTFLMAILIALTVLAVQPAEAQQVQEVVKAKSFVLVDEMGRTRASLLLRDDEPALTLFNKNGKPQLRVMLIDGIPVIGLINENDAPGMMLMCQKGSRLMLADESGETRLFLSATVEDGPAIGLLDEEGEPIWGWPHAIP